LVAGLNLTADRWREHFEVLATGRLRPGLLAGSEEGIATNILADRRKRRGSATPITTMLIAFSANRSCPFDHEVKRRLIGWMSPRVAAP
jgi:hypothetical protein